MTAAARAKAQARQKAAQAREKARAAAVSSALQQMNGAKASQPVPNKGTQYWNDATSNQRSKTGAIQKIGFDTEQYEAALQQVARSIVSDGDYAPKPISESDRTQLSKDDVTLVAKELNVTTQEAERLLVAAKHDVVDALLAGVSRDYRSSLAAA